ncbi:MAG: DNA polymerase IV [Acidimicrobiales bacterium]
MPDTEGGPGSAGSGLAGSGLEGSGLEACTVLHVDMDAFFASVEVLDNPELAGKPVIVGGSSTRGVVASCTYEARAFGIRSAMSSVEARRRCPEAIFLPGRYWRYSETSEKFHTVLKEFTPFVEGIGLDEAFLDIRGALKLLGSPAVIASALRSRVVEELHINCSVGVARTKMLAKLGSRAAKPKADLSGPRVGSGVFVIRPEEELAFLRPLPVRAIWGVGPATAERLASVGVETVADISDIPIETLCRLLGGANGRHIAALACGEDETTVHADREVKSISHEETFAKDIHDRHDLQRNVLRMSDAVGARLVEAALWGKTVSVKVRFADRQTITRSHTADGPLRASHAISSIARALVEGVELIQGVRLIGVSVSGLARADKDVVEQLSFDAFSGPARGVSSDQKAETADIIDTDEQAWLDVQDAISTIRARYGQGSVGPAALVGPKGLEAKQRGDTHWGPEAEAEDAVTVKAEVNR